MSCLPNLTKVHRSPEWKMQRSIFVKQSQDIFPRFRATVVSRRRCDTIVLWFQTLVGIDHAMLCSWTLTFQNCLINVIGYHRYLWNHHFFPVSEFHPAAMGAFRPMFLFSNHSGHGASSFWAASAHFFILSHISSHGRHRGRKYQNFRCSIWCFQKNPSVFSIQFWMLIFQKKSPALCKKLVFK